MQNYGEYMTEQSAEESRHIDEMPTLEMLTLINREDQKAALAVKEELPHIAEAVDAIAVRLRAGGRLFYLGAGTSGRLGVIDAAECPPTYGTSPETVQAVIAGGDMAVFRAQERGEDNGEGAVSALQERGFSANDVCFGLSASGSAEFVRAALVYARSLGALTVLLCCNPKAPTISLADIAIVPDTGAEVISGSTRMKAATAQKMVLTSVSTGVMVRLGRVRGNKMVCMHASNQKLRARAVRMVCELTGVTEEQAQTALEACSYDVSAAADMLKQ